MKPVPPTPTGRVERKIHLLNEIAYVCAKQARDNARSMEFLDHAFDLLERDGSLLEQALQKKKIGDFLFASKEMQEAYMAYKTALKLIESVGKETDVANLFGLAEKAGPFAQLHADIHNSLGDLFYAVGTFKYARLHFESAADIYSSLGYTSKLWRSLTSLRSVSWRAPNHALESHDLALKALRCCRHTMDSNSLSASSFKFLDQRLYALSLIDIGTLAMSAANPRGSGGQGPTPESVFEWFRDAFWAEHKRLRENIELIDLDDIFQEPLVESPLAHWTREDVSNQGLRTIFECERRCSPKTSEDDIIATKLWLIAECCFDAARKILRRYTYVLDNALALERHGVLIFTVCNARIGLSRAQHPTGYACKKLLRQSIDYLSKATEIFATHRHLDPTVLWMIADTHVELGNAYWLFLQAFGSPVQIKAFKERASTYDFDKETHALIEQAQDIKNGSALTQGKADLQGCVKLPIEASNNGSVFDTMCRSSFYQALVLYNEEFNRFNNSYKPSPHRYYHRGDFSDSEEHWKTAVALWKRSKQRWSWHLAGAADEKKDDAAHEAFQSGLDFTSHKFKEMRDILAQPDRYSTEDLRNAAKTFSVNVRKISKDESIYFWDASGLLDAIADLEELEHDPAHKPG